jgi:hypothetical protein
MAAPMDSVTAMAEGMVAVMEVVGAGVAATDRRSAGADFLPSLPRPRRVSPRQATDFLVRARK